MLNEIKKMLLIMLKITIIAGILGGLFSFILKWPIYKGVYIFILIPGIMFIAYAGINFIGVPQDRMDFFSGKMQEKNKEKPKNERKILGDEGWAPALAGIVMIAISFLIEAIFRNM